MTADCRRHLFGQGDTGAQVAAKFELVDQQLSLVAVQQRRHTLAGGERCVLALAANVCAVQRAGAVSASRYIARQGCPAEMAQQMGRAVLQRLPAQHAGIADQNIQTSRQNFHHGSVAVVRPSANCERLHKICGFLPLCWASHVCMV